MEITLAEFGRDARTITVPTACGPVEVTYRPSLITPEFEADAATAAKPAVFYAQAVAAWTLTDARGVELPRDDDTLRGVIPLGFLDAVRASIAADVEGDEHIVRDLRRSLTSGGNLGLMRWWYPVIRAARYLGCDPWALAKQPVQWQNWALQSETAEHQAQAEMQEAAAKKARR